MNLPLSSVSAPSVTRLSLIPLAVEGKTELTSGETAMALLCFCVENDPFRRHCFWLVPVSTSDSIKSSAFDFKEDIINCLQCRYLDAD